jgi:integrase
VTTTSKEQLSTPLPTLLLANGENAKVASKRLGHSTIVLTLDTSSHVLPGMQQQAADRIEALLFKAS